MLGKQYMIALEQYQLFLGLEKPLLMQSPENFQYGETHIIQYIWEACAISNLQFHIPNLRIQKRRFSNDKFLMDIFLDLKVPTTIRKVLNNVRLWLRVSRLSDIFDPVTQRLHPWVMSATSQSTSMLEWPQRCRPSPYAIRQWKTYISLLCKGQRESLFELGTPLLPEVTSIPYQLEPSPTFSQFKNQLPIHLLDFALEHDIGCPIDNNSIPTIIQWLQEGTLIAASDGSELNRQGAHAIGFTTKKEVDSIYGGAMRTPGNEEEMSSLRAEHAGIITLLLTLQFLQTKIDLTSSLSVTLYVDSAAVLDRIAKSPTRAQKDHDTLDYDLWILQHHLIAQININLLWKKIKSHPSKEQRQAQGVIPSRLNEQVDLWATAAQQIRYGPKAFPIPQVPITPIIETTCIHGPIRPHIKFHATKTSLQNYICKRNKWTEQVFQTIDWDATKYAIKKFPREKRVNVVKYLHDWQRTGQQISLFSVDHAPEDVPEAPDNNDKCPVCGQFESHLHYFSCQSPLLLASHVSFVDKNTSYS